MPYAEGEGAKIFWREEGEGEPLLLVMGLGCASDVWFRATQELARGHRVILFDNRGIGRSDAPPGPYSIAQMADDAAAVLDAAGEESAHVFGYSMGGMVAQELVMRHTPRVRSLILGATHCGRPHAVHPAQEVIDALTARAANPVEAFWAMAPFMFDPSTPRSRVEEDLGVRGRAFPRRESYLAQLGAITAWGPSRGLDSIEVPTLVIHGETDRLIPVENGERLAREIPGARFVRLKEASHVFTTDKTRESLSAVLSFLRDAAQPSSDAMSMTKR